MSRLIYLLISGFLIDSEKRLPRLMKALIHRGNSAVMQAPGLLLTGNRELISRPGELHALGQIVVMPAREQILAPGQVVLGR